MTATSERFDVAAERRRLGAMTAGQLRQRYQEIGGDEARSRNRQYLIRRILWMLQAGVYGGLSERTMQLLARERAVARTWWTFHTQPPAGRIAEIPQIGQSSRKSRNGDGSAPGATCASTKRNSVNPTCSKTSRYVSGAIQKLSKMHASPVAGWIDHVMDDPSRCGFSMYRRKLNSG